MKLQLRGMEESLNSVYDSMAITIHQQIGKLLADDKKKQYDVSELNF